MGRGPNIGKAVLGGAGLFAAGLAAVFSVKNAKTVGRAGAAFVRKGHAARLGSRIINVSILGLGVLFLGFAPQIPPGADIWNVNRPPSITLLDKDEAFLASRGAVYGEAVGLEELPPYLVQAFLATEDRRFYNHRGVDMRGTARAFVANVRAGSLREGGSTITQQLAKNLYLSPDRTLTRKAKEAMLALWLEGRYEKDEILSLYLNRIYLGAGAYGIEAASQHYFGKSARDVTLAEAAMLAGLPKAPTAYAPTRNLEAAQTRAAVVLDNLVEADHFTAFQVEEAKAAPAMPLNRASDSELGYFFDYIAAEAVRLAPGAEDLVVRTTLDVKLQKMAESAVTRALEANGEELQVGQAALVAFDRGGALRAMVGGKSYKESQFNRAVQAKRQPGSAFKPFVYLAALENGLTPKSKFVDGPIEIGNWAPTNYKEGFAGEVRLTEAMAQSINTVAVQVAEETGRETVIDTARRLGIGSPLTPHPSLALGASEVTLYELTSAYIPFQRRGMAEPSYAIVAITDGAGNELFAHPETKAQRLMSRETADDMSHMMYQVMHSGTGARAQLRAHPAAGKTGTSQDWRDAWFLGYTHDLLAGVWVGNDDGSPMDEVTGGGLPAEIWRDFMSAALINAPSKKIPGAYPAVNYESEEDLVAFYEGLSAAFSDASSSGPFRRGGLFRRN